MLNVASCLVRVYCSELPPGSTLADAPDRHIAPKQHERENYYDTNAKRLSLLGHISIGERDLGAAEAFYTAVFAPLNVSLVFSDRKTARTLGYGWGEWEPINIFERKKDAAPPGAGFHIAFNAPSRGAVDDFYKAAMEHGGKDDGKHGIREMYRENYYACFVYDPDGYRLEAVCQQPVDN